MNYLIFCIMLNLFNFASSQNITTTEIYTNYGVLLGLTQTVGDAMYNAFLGVPYAQPPVNDLRFEPAQRVDDWGYRTALDFAKACPQPDVDFNLTSEDCLYLDVWVPGNITERQADTIPVMVFIHGGALVSGSSEQYLGFFLLSSDEPVIVVVIQYRLGFLGFVTTGDEAISGNLGLRDQVFALQWVQENIAAFGGDSESVTIFGESAGAESVIMHMVSPMSNGLFNRAIAQSVPAYGYYYQREELAGHLNRTAIANGCPEDNVIECLRSIPWQFIVESDFNRNNGRAIIDGEFLLDQPINRLINGDINDADLIIGFNNDDGDDPFLFILESLYPNIRTAGTSDISTYNYILSECLSFVAPKARNILDSESISYLYNEELPPISNLEQVLSVLRGKYTSYGDPIANTRGLLDASRDSFWASFAVRAAHLVDSWQRTVYMYTFEHRSSYLGIPDPDELPLYAPHAGELPYLFGDLDPYYLTSEEQALVRSMVKAWTSFATSGSPKFLTQSGAEESWPMFTSELKRYLRFDVAMTAENVQSLELTWQPVADFWQAVESLVIYEEDDVDEEDNNGEDSSAELKTDILKLDSFQADLVIIILTVVCLLLLLAGMLICCIKFAMMCSGSSGSKYDI